jgi:hypothetical protein
MLLQVSIKHHVNNLKYREDAWSHGTASLIARADEVIQCDALKQ